MIRYSRLCPTLGLVMTAFLATTTGRAQTITLLDTLGSSLVYDNTAGQQVGYEGTENSPTYFRSVALSFTVPVDGLRLNSLAIAVAPFATSPTKLAFQVATDAGGQPSTWFLGTGTPISGETVLFFTDPFTTDLLTKDATYWLIINGDPSDPDTPSSHLILFNSSTVAAAGQLLASGDYMPPITPGNASASWTDIGTQEGNYLPAVTITAVAVPEPATTAVLAGVAVLGFVAWRRIRGQRTTRA